jgi:Raf kinase inhibitor-like YbhB/YbcL family protein
VAFALTSAAFAAGETIPRRHTCDGENVSPPLSWQDAPSGVRSFALICDDPDAPGGVWFHWAIHGIPAGTSSFGAGPRPSEGMKLGLNDFRRKRYEGPCPPPGHGQHRYRFKLYALSVENLGVKDGAHCRDVEQAARAHALAVTELVGVYARGG